MTSQERFEIAVQTVLRHEGGFVHDALDDGGATNFGIASAHHDVDVATLTRADAIEIYRRDYWARYRLDEIENPVVATKALDLCVWMGPDDAGAYLQAAICAAAGTPLVAVDGVIGSKTLAALAGVDAGMVLVAMRSLTLAHVLRQVADDPSEARFARGWCRRAVA